jgi:hypothetical protein
MNYTEIADKHGADVTICEAGNVVSLLESELTSYSKEIERLALEKIVKEYEWLGDEAVSASTVVKHARKLIEELEE